MVKIRNRIPDKGNEMTRETETDKTDKPVALSGVEPWLSPHLGSPRSCGWPRRAARTSSGLERTLSSPHLEEHPTPSLPHASTAESGSPHSAPRPKNSSRRKLNSHKHYKSDSESSSTLIAGNNNITAKLLLPKPEASNFSNSSSHPFSYSLSFPNI